MVTIIWTEITIEGVDLEHTDRRLPFQNSLIMIFGWGELLFLYIYLFQLRPWVSRAQASKHAEGGLKVGIISPHKYRYSGREQHAGSYRIMNLGIDRGLSLSCRV